MPEGHTVHRIAHQFGQHFVGCRIAASSPQGRFAAGAAELDGRTMLAARAVGKQMFLEFEGDRWLRVHLGLYGAWDFAGEMTTDAPLLSSGDGEASLHSIGAPRRARFRMSEGESLRELEGEGQDSFPPDPVGQVRVRLLTGASVADLRGPTACEVLDPAQVQVQLAKLGPDPLVDDLREGEERFVGSVRKRATPIGLLLMDQSVIGGIGNVYRAELLFRAGLNPHTPGKQVSEEKARELWRDWARLQRVGVETGQMMTMEGLDEEAHRKAMASRDDRHWVYHRAGEPCRVCGTDIVVEPAAGRKLYWCPSCQA